MHGIRCVQRSMPLTDLGRSTCQGTTVVFVCDSSALVDVVINRARQREITVVCRCVVL